MYSIVHEAIKECSSTTELYVQEVFAQFVYMSEEPLQFSTTKNSHQGGVFCTHSIRTKNEKGTVL